MNICTSIVDNSSRWHILCDDWVVSGLLCTVFSFSTYLAFMISTNLIVKHLRYYSKPQEQKWILRLIFIVPIYAMTSWISLMLFGENANDAYVYLDTIRSCYEAFVIYCFLSLCFDGYLGGESRIVQQLNGQPLPASRRSFTCCLKGKTFGLNTLRFCKQATE